MYDLKLSWQINVQKSSQAISHISVDLETSISEISVSIISNPDNGD
jgi:hypothetical protein